MQLYEYCPRSFFLTGFAKSTKTTKSFDINVVVNRHEETKKWVDMPFMRYLEYNFVIWMSNDDVDLNYLMLLQGGKAPQKF